MDILSLIDKFIQWCDGNVGFLNVILSLCTLILTVTIAKLPYKKKIVGSLEIIPEKTQYEPFFKCFIRVYLTNVGRVPIYSCEGMFVDSVFIKHVIDLNGYVKIKVTDISGKKYYISRTFPVG